MKVMVERRKMVGAEYVKFGIFFFFFSLELVLVLVSGDWK